MRWTALVMALRSLGRNPRRTALSVVGIAIGCSLAVLMIGLQYGGKDVYIRGMVEMGAGHLRIAPEDWVQRRDPRLRLKDSEGALAAARAAPGVAVVAPRVRAPVLLAMGSRVQGVELTGVDPQAEPRANRLARTVAEGRYLAPGERGAVVLGRELAVRLRVEIDDDLVATGVAAGGEMQSAMLRIVGLIATGSRDVDAAIAHVSVEDAAALSGSPGLGEISLLLTGFEEVKPARSAIEPRLATGDVVIDFAQVEPGLYSHIEQDRATSNVFISLIVLLVFLGLASAELTSVLERRREFAILAAVGMRPRQLAAQSLLEGALLGVAGTVASLAVSVPALWWMSTRGLDISPLLEGGLSFESMFIEPRIYAGFGLWILRDVAILAVGSTLVAALYPAWFAARVDPSTALRTA